MLVKQSTYCSEMTRALHSALLRIYVSKSPLYASSPTAVRASRATARRRSSTPTLDGARRGRLRPPHHGRRGRRGRRPRRRRSTAAGTARSRSSSTRCITPPEGPAGGPGHRHPARRPARGLLRRRRPHRQAARSPPSPASSPRSPATPSSPRRSAATCSAPSGRLARRSSSGPRTAARSARTSTSSCSPRPSPASCCTALPDGRAARPRARSRSVIDQIILPAAGISPPGSPLNVSLHLSVQTA